MDRDALLPIAAIVAIFVMTIQTHIVHAFHEQYGLSDEELKSSASTNPELRDAVDVINSIGNDLIANCGAMSNMLQENSEGGTLRGSAESIMLICDHNALYEKGMCLTHADLFSFCGRLGPLETYLEDRNIINSPPERTFLGLDGSVMEDMTNTDLQ